MEAMISRLIPLFACAAVLCAQNGTVGVHEDTLTLTTYDEGAPDVNPQFGAFYQDIFPNYPYPIRTPVNKVAHPVAWRVLILENEYLSCRVLPDLGGHLHGCTDKITGKEIFYSNPAIRRTAESARRSFIATGIESSFPVAHSRVDSSPVDFAWSVRDGVGRVVVEDIDRTSGMEWRVEFVLRSGVAVLEQHVTLYNRSDARRGYHWWANAAIELNDPHLRIVYPVKWMLPHGDGPMTSWPLDAKGTDLSDAANHKKQIGLFAHGSQEPWMAIYKPASRSGVAHYADPKQIKGKKIWLWGTDDKYVQSNLTDKFNSYVEMQAGEFETKTEFAFLLPQQTKAFTHYWIPFHDLGGIARATPDAVLNLSRSGQSVLVELDATHMIKGAKIRLSNGAKLLSETPADLDPKVKFAKTVTGTPAKITVDLLSAEGKVLLHQVEGEYNSIPFDPAAKNPEPVPPSDTSDAEAAILERGTYYEQRDQWAPAWQGYEAGLLKSPGSAALKLAAGRAAFTLNRYDDAVRLLRELAATDPEAAYYYGCALASDAPHAAEARIALSAAAKDSRYGAAARRELALLAARESKGPALADAVRLLQAVAAAPGAPARVGALEVAMLRRTGNPDEAKKRLQVWLSADPADDMLRLEATYLGVSADGSVWDHLGADPDRLLNVAEDYRRLGAWDDALKILDRRYTPGALTQMEPGTVMPQYNTLVVYYRAYCRQQLGQDPKPDFRVAGGFYSLYAFPHRHIEFRIFEAALAANDRDAVAHALLGDLYFDSLQTGPAIDEWTKALALKRDLPALHRNLGRALLEIRNDPAAATPILVEGRKLDPNDREIAAMLTRLNIAPEPEPKPVVAPAPAPPTSLPKPVSIAPPLNAPAAPPAPPTPVVATAPSTPADLAGRALVRSLTDPEQSAGQFNARNFPQEKQPAAVRRAYIEVQLQLLVSRAYGGHCGDLVQALETLGDEDSGLPFTLYGFTAFMKSAHFQYYMGIVENSCGAEKAAKKRWSKISRSTEPPDSPDYAFPLLAANKLGESDARTRINSALAALSKTSADDSKPDAAFARGALLLATGNSGEGNAVLQKTAHSADPFVQYLSLAVLRDAARK